MFVDQVTIHVKGGKGGDGVTSFRRQPYEPKGPPEGGDGGEGGSVIAVGQSRLTTLVDFHYRPHRFAKSGKNGSGDLRRGADGEHEYVYVPLGTTITDTETGEVIGDMLREGQEIVLAAGGRGGRGNAQFRTRARRSPAFCEMGVPGDVLDVQLELKLIADVALVGFPNSGKSSLIRTLSAARPKVADYPFTTLVPNLGVVDIDEFSYVIADVPGLIEGAAMGKGLGHEFLRHVERAKVLVHVLDCASGYAATQAQGEKRYEQRIPTDDYETILGELQAYAPELLERPAILWLNKTDADPDMATLVEEALQETHPDAIVMSGSAVTGDNTRQLARILAKMVREANEAHLQSIADNPKEALHEEHRPTLRPREFVPKRAIDITKVGLGGHKVGWIVKDARFERWIQQLDMHNDEAVAYVQGRLRRAGLEQALTRAGASLGDDVQIGKNVFVFNPEHWVVDEEDTDFDESQYTEEFGVDIVEYSEDDLAFNPVYEVTEDGPLAWLNDEFGNGNMGRFSVMDDDEFDEIEEPEE